MKTLKKILMAATIPLLITGCSTTSTSTNNSKNETSDSSSQLGNFKLVDIAGNEHSLSEYKGKKVYIKYWASWCSICLATLNSADELAGKNNDFVTISIVAPNYNNEKNTEDFKKWYSTLGYKNLTVFLDNDGLLAKKLGVKAYPTSIFIDTTNNVVKIQTGHVETDKIEEIMKILN